MNTQTKDTTMEEKTSFNDKKKEATKAYSARKDSARKIVMGYFESDESNRVPEEVKTAILYLSGKGVRSTRTGVTSELKKILLAGPVSLMDIFQKFEYGRPTMEIKIRNFINCKNPDDRIWVDFKDGNYSIVGTGVNPPEGWDGYIPKEKVEAEEL